MTCESGEHGSSELNLPDFPPYDSQSADGIQSKDMWHPRRCKTMRFRLACLLKKPFEISLSPQNLSADHDTYPHVTSSQAKQQMDTKVLG